ncbi:hypothetical protein ADEAN_000886300 [Angomonas deanei]|uniref:Fibronectin type-III domain-containing protein n=1 Tax=Angomonas deanei TaxID=59799 RepID=A0A7G2CQR1_9TRYP|nr:hypothetical protein ADEAN_000886300 [Angomonas deanei]
MSEELPSLKDVEELSPSDVNVTDAIDLSCRTVVVRMGERLGEFAIEFDGDMSAQVHVNKWQLFVYEVNPNDIADNSKNLDNETFSPLEQTGTEVTFNSILEPSKNSKIVKLAPGKVYRCGTRFHTDRWSAWSAPVMTSSFHSVVVHPSDIGEDSIRLCWGRAAERFLEGCAAELDSLSTKAVGDIAKFQLRVTRQRDNVREFDEEFDSSVRSVTVHSLIPGTAYVVEMRYESLLQTFFNWSEVLRFYTDAPMYVELLSRGEDVFSISWRREDLPPDTIGYRLPTTEVLFYELHIDGEGSSGTSIEIPAKDSTYRATQLFPGGEYSVYLRCLTKDGRWGGRSRVLEVRTACIPDLELLSVGESFLTVRWVRRVDEPGETRLEYELYELRGGYRHGMSLTGSTEVDTGKKYFTVSDLSPSTEYSVSVRLYVDGEWGRWTEPKSFFTNSKPALTLLERGEDFFTVKWPKVDGASSKTAAPQYNIVVKKRNENGPHSVILDQNVTPDSNPGFRVNNLDTDGVYEMTCRVLQVDDLTHTQLWGDYSPPLTVRTLRPVAVEVWDLGEDFVHVVWKHGLTDRGDSQANQNWRILKYEVVVGCMDTQEDEILHREVLDTNYLIKNLRPSFTYIISVRAFSERHQWGVWSKVTVRTFAPVRTSIHEIGEDYVRLMWHRRNTSQETESTETISAANYVSQYSILVFSVSDTEEDNVADDVSGYPRGGSARVVRRMTVPSYHSSLLINNLLPNLKYEAVVQASTESGKWGLWSTPLHFRTNSQVTIPVDNLSIGENYVNLEWERTAAPASSEENVQVGDLTIVAQQLRIRGVQGSAFSKDYNLKAEDRTLKVDGLSPATAYSVCIRVCGKSGLWGLWSQPIHVLTRGTILTKTVEVAENYIITAWERAKVPNPNRYPTGRGVVTTYHLRVYNQEGTHTETFLGDGDCPLPRLQSQTRHLLLRRAEGQLQ